MTSAITVAALAATSVLMFTWRAWRRTWANS
jgi:hypothetical protein